MSIKGMKDGEEDPTTAGTEPKCQSKRCKMERRIQQEQEQNQNVDQRAEQNRTGQEQECKSKRDPERGMNELDPDLPCTLTNLPLRFQGISGNKLPLLVEKQS